MIIFSTTEDHYLNSKMKMSDYNLIIESKILRSTIFYLCLKEDPSFRYTSEQKICNTCPIEMKLIGMIDLDVQIMY